MSRSIQYRITYANNKKSVVCGLFNGHSAESLTSHFNGYEKERFYNSIVKFETENKKRIVKRELVAHASDKNGKCFNESVKTDYDYKFETLFDSFLSKLNTFNGKRM